MLPELTERLLDKWNSLFPNTEKPSGVRYLGIPGSVEGGTTTFLGFPNGKNKPAFAVKIHRDHDAAQRAHSERRVLSFLRQQAGTLAGSVPRVLLCDQIGGAWILVQSVLEGRPMSVTRFNDGMPEVNETARNARLAATWLAALHKITRDDLLEASLEVEKRGMKTIEEFSRLFELSVSEQRYLNALADALGSVVGGRAFVEHGDFCRQNILISKENGRPKVGVIDWTDAQLAGFPVHDLFFFLAMYFLRVKKHSSIRDFVRTFESTFFGGNAHGAVVKQCITTYCRRVGVPLENLEPLFALFLIKQAVFECHQLMQCARHSALPRSSLYLAALEDLDYAKAVRSNVWAHFFRRFITIKGGLSAMAEQQRSRSVGKPRSEQHVAVSVVIPCRNERDFIGLCLDSVLANDYPKAKLEVLVVDGMSNDGTRTIVQEYERKHPFIRLVDNPKGIIPSALNIGIQAARGQVLIRLDSHTVCEKDYISKCVEYLFRYDAENVGGVWKIVPRRNTLRGKAIAQALSCSFGIGNAHYRLAPKQARWVDTVPFFCCRKRLFQRIGTFDERVLYTEDMELNSRLRRSGGKILLVPQIVSYYYARSDLTSFWRHNWRNGVWAILPSVYVEGMPVAFRHIVPLLFVSSLLTFPLLSLAFPVFLLPALVIAGCYAVANMGFSIAIALRERTAVYLCAMPLVFASLHIAYGLGSLLGLAKLLVFKVLGPRRAISRA